MAEKPKVGKTVASSSGMQAAISNAGLMRSLASENSEIREAATQQALKMRDGRAIEPLLFILQSKDDDARTTSAQYFDRRPAQCTQSNAARLRRADHAALSQRPGRDRTGPGAERR